MEDGSIYRSIDNGATFQDIGLSSFGMDSSDTSQRIELAISPMNNNRILAGIISGGATDFGQLVKLYLTNNGLATTSSISWTDVAQPTASGITDICMEYDDAIGWYAFTLTFDPLNNNRFLIGSIYLFRGNIASASPTVTYSALSTSSSTMHPDYHYFCYYPGSSSKCYIANDGGVYKSLNINLTTPTFSFISTDLNITQFYSIAITPTANKFLAIGGTQDNGTRRFNNNASSISSATKVIGGDGGYCFIDQTEPHKGITSNTYNYFYKSTDTLLSVTAFPRISNNGLFINPADYHDDSDILFSGDSIGFVAKWSNIFSGALLYDPITDSDFSSFEASHINISPNLVSGFTFPTVYIGTKKGRVFKILNSTTSPNFVNITTNILPSILSGGYVSCIEVKKTGLTSSSANDTIAVTYSNYGVPHVWYTTNGSSASPTWSNISGDLPDMPVRWALFAPNGNAYGYQLLIATELGVWTTTSINGASTHWEAINTGLANVRTEMLKIRPSDKMLYAATFGRGIFRSDMFSPIKISFKTQYNSYGSYCNVKFIDQSTTPTTTPIAAWAWDFQNNGTIDATIQNPTIERESIGAWVKLTISGTFGNISYLKTRASLFSNSNMMCPVDAPTSAISRLSADSIENIQSNIIGSSTIQSEYNISIDEIIIFPNPTNSVINIKTNTNAIPQEVILFDLNGKQIISNKDREQIDLSELVKGTYIISIKYENQTPISTTIIKQ